MKWLQISQSELVQLLRKGELPRPGRIDKGEVAWRRDEIEAVADRLERERARD